jgi:hypothetical protein
MGEAFRVPPRKQVILLALRTKKSPFERRFVLCGVLDDVRTELMKSKIIPYISNL